MASELSEPDTQTMKPNDAYIHDAILSIKQTGRFSHSTKNQSTAPHLSAATTANQTNSIMNTEPYHKEATSSHIRLNKIWKKQLDKAKQKAREKMLNGEEREHEDQNLAEAIHVNRNAVDLDDESDVQSLTEQVTSITAISFRKHQEQISKQFTLNEAQTRAFMIITDHINGDNHLKKDNKQDQLLMCVPGPGGTGKSQLIHAITEYFSITKRSHELRKLAPTSNAAAQIDGLTIHSFTSYRNLKKISAVQRTTIEKEWRHIRYIIIDEMSTVGLYLLGQLGGLLTLAKHCGPSIPFGDINVIFFGDFIQYDPVGDQALYSDIISDKTRKKKKIREIRAATCASGRALWEQINTVVKLEKQMRTSDSRYLQLLQRLRKGECT
ncbi:unnamed protein product, partial [Didymodactylos carnosus]